MKGPAECATRAHAGISGTEQGQLELGDEGLCSVLGAPGGMRLDLGTCLKGGDDGLLQYLKHCGELEGLSWDP